VRGYSKYGAKKTVVDGLTFASKAEARRYGELKLLQAAGEIIDLELQPKYDIVVNGEKICQYRGDFSYREEDASGWWQLVVEDVKGFKTPEYKLKAKLLRATHGIEIRETK
jgi:hypothetical protein